MTIQHFIVLHKIEKAKELILYNELTLNEITHQLQYSSVAHLSTQFKQVTGITPTHFKKVKTFKNRVFLEQIELNNLRLA
jgi:AraC-like DNA-binding protein